MRFPTLTAAPSVPPHKGEGGPIDAVAINAVLVAARQAVDVICDRWTLAILAAALMGETRFGAIAARTGIAGRLLTGRLRTLEADGLLRRDGAAYRLTAMGAAAAPIIGQMRRWEAMSAPLVCAACGQAVTAREIDLKLSPARRRAAPQKQTARRRSSLSNGSGGAPGVDLGESLDVFGDKWGSRSCCAPSSGCGGSATFAGRSGSPPTSWPIAWRGSWPWAC